MVTIMKGPRAKKFNKFKKRHHKPKHGNGHVPAEKPRELPKNDTEAKVHLVTQDIKFALALAGNDKKVRDKFLKNLKSWLNQRSNTSFPFTDEDFLRLWKGLYYCMWMSDKPLVQEQLCEDMGSLVHCFDQPAVAVQFYGRFLETMSHEWLGIDHWRLDKFMMLVRRVTRQLFAVLHRHQWAPELLQALRREVAGTVLQDGKLSFGCTMHFLSLFWEEVAKVSDGQLPAKAVTGLVRPFLAFLSTTHDQRLSKRVVVDIFYGLLKQSDLGRQHEEKYEVWKQFGFPSARISDLELVPEDEDQGEAEEEEQEEEEDAEIDAEKSAEKTKGDNEKPAEQIALDPRAGNVSVVLPEIPFNARKIHQLLEKALYDAGTRSANRRVLKKIMANYERFSNGDYPLGIQRVTLPSMEAAKLPNIDEKVQELEQLEEAVMEESRLLKTLSRGEKKRFYKSGMKLRDYLESLGKITKDSSTNGMVVEEEEQEEEPAKEGKSKNKKKRKAATEAIAVGEKKFKGASQSPLDSSINNGFEVEEEEGAVEAPKDEDKPSKKAIFDIASEWEKPLEEGEVEYVVTPTKQRLKHLNAALDDLPVVATGNGAAKHLVKNPFAVKKQKKNAPDSPRTPVPAKLLPPTGGGSAPNSSGKRVKIVLEKNMAQEKSEYFRQLRNSPQIPFDSTKKPAKGLLKPHSVPSPINPYYKKKMGLNLDD